MSSEKKHSPPRGEPDEIERIVHEALTAWEAGKPLHEDDIAARHPELMPRIAENIRNARTLFLARKKAEAARDNSGNGNANSKHQDHPLKHHFPGFTIIGDLEHGGQGKVYRAVQLATGRTVALKVLLDGPLSSPQQHDRFIREVEIISRLNHPNIVTIFHSDIVAGRPFYAMEYIEGLPIDDYVLLNQPTVKDCVKLFITICHAVGHAHYRGIIHRDLKPTNILIDLNDQPKILDFGLAKSLEAAGDTSYSSLSLTGQVFGTLPYMSPEQVAGSSAGEEAPEVDILSDVYSLGVILYHLLTGMYPYPVAGDPVDVRSNILHQEPLALARALRRGDASSRPTTGAIEDDLDKVILKALSKEKERRYQSAIAFAEDLERYLRGEPVEAKAASRLYLFKKTVRRYRLQFAAAAVIALTMTTATILTTYYGLKATRERDNARAVAAFAHSLFDEVATTIEEDMASLAGGTAVRDKHLENLAERLVTLQELVEADGGMGDLEAKIHEKRGELAMLRGDKSEARWHYDQMQRIYAVQERQANGPGQDLSHLRRCQRIHSKLAHLKEDDQDEQYLEARRIGRLLLARSPDDLPALLDHTQLLLLHSNLLLERGRPLDAMEPLDELVALGILDKFDDESFTPGQVARADFFTLRSRAKSHLGDGAGCHSDLEKCLEIRRRLCKNHPTNVQYMDDLRITFCRAATFSRNIGEFDRAAELLTEAVRIGEYLVRAEPDRPDWHSELIRAYNLLTSTLLRMDKLDEALHPAQRSIDLASALVARHPTDADYLRTLAIAHYYMGRILNKAQDWQRAYVSYEEARLIYVRLLEAQPEDYGVIQSLANTMNALGRCARMLGSPIASLSLYLQAHEMLQELVRLQPESVRNHSLLISSCNKFTVWHLDARTEADNDAAEFWLNETERLLEEFCRSGGTTSRATYYDADADALVSNRAILAKRRAAALAAKINATD